MVKVVVVDDHPSTQIGLENIFNTISDIEVIATVATATELFSITESQDIDVVVLDISLKNDDEGGFKIIKKMKGEGLKCQVLIHSMHDEARYIKWAKKENATGYLLKSASPNEIILAIRTVARGDSYYNEEVQAILGANGTEEAQANHNGFYLTDREKELLRYIIRGHAKGVISQAMGCAPATIDRHRKNILRKAKESLDIHTMEGVVGYVLKHGLLDDEEDAQ